ncbi:MAG: aminopeptidase P family N-terminal domain-containing protein, partial [Paramuribaculum sp.]|nr:aminopeptidase P family N-terminal domain-containing protein [Paramuribaculum sp.]
MQLNLLPHNEAALRIEKVRSAMAAQNLEAVLIADNANLYYLTGRVFAGYIYIPAIGETRCFVRRPVKTEGENVIPIRKPEQISESIGSVAPSTIGLETDTLPYSLVLRLSAVFPGVEIGNASAVMRQARAVKTTEEIKKIETSGIKQAHVYSLIPSLFHEGMTDIELQIEIEKASRLEGCLGQFRIAGNSMELYMANLLSGDNADNPTPYDFAMGG